MAVVGVPQTPPSWLGPLFAIETARQTRRGHGFWLRCIFVALLLGVFYYLYAPRFGVDFKAFSFGATGSISYASAERFAMTVFFQSMLWLSVGLLLITPSYVATAIAEEKEKGTIEMLFTTFITSRELVLGKLSSRLLHLAAFFVAGLPVLCLARIWGGPALEEIAMGYAVLFLALFSVGSVSIFFSVRARTVLGAELSSYGATIVVSLVLLLFSSGALWSRGRIDGKPYVSSPVAFFLQWENRYENTESHQFMLGYYDRQSAFQQLRQEILGWLLRYGLVQGAVGAVFLWRAIHTARPVCLADANRAAHQPGQTRVLLRRHRRASVVTDTRREADPLWTMTGQPAPVELPEPEMALYVRNYRLHPVKDDALLWREMHHGSSMAHPRTLRVLRAGLALLLLLGVIVIGMLYAAWWGENQGAVRPARPRLEAAILAGSSADHSGVTRAWNGLRTALQMGVLFAMTAWCGAVGLRTANTLSLERGRQTLMSLLTLPVSRREILQAKWRGGILRYQWLGWVMLTLLVLNLLAGTLAPLMLPLLALSFVVHLTFLASFGLWLSLVVRTQLTVQMCMGTIVLLMCAAPMLVAIYAPDDISLSQRSTLWYRFQDAGASPVNTWWALLSESPAMTTRYVNTMVAIFLGLLLYAGAGWAFWKGACLLFNRVQGDEVGGRH